MSTSQTSHAMPATNELTIDKVKRWNTNQLLEWIQQNLVIPLDDEDKELFSKAKIDGEAFLDLAGDRDYFRSVGLSPGASQKLALLSKDLTGRKSKCCPLHYIVHATAS
jgi:hypothetical protein